MFWDDQQESANSSSLACPLDLSILFSLRGLRRRREYMAFFWRRKKEDKFSSSVLGLDKSVEELKAQEEAVERELGVRFSRAIEKTRHSINNRLDTIFEG